MADVRRSAATFHPVTIAVTGDGGTGPVTAEVQREWMATGVRRRSAAVGRAVGLGRPATALMVTALALVILSPLRRIEGRLEARQKRRKRAGNGANSP